MLSENTYSSFGDIGSTVSATLRSRPLRIGGYGKALYGNGPDITIELNIRRWKYREGTKVEPTGLILEPKDGGTKKHPQQLEEARNKRSVAAFQRLVAARAALAEDCL